MRIRFSGTRGSSPAAGTEYLRYGGESSCVFIRTETETIFLDAGTGILREAGEIAQGEPIHILLSHSHVDHIQGLLFLQQMFREGNVVDIYGKSRMGLSVREQIRRLMSPPLWPVGPDDFQKGVHYRETENEFYIGKTRIQVMEVPHPGGCLAYRLSSGGKSVVYATDAEFYPEVPREFLDFTRGCDLLILDGQYSPEEYRKKQGWGHSSREIGVWIAGHHQVGQIKLFHHDLRADDEYLDAVERSLRERTQNCSLAVQGEEIIL